MILEDLDIIHNILLFSDVDSINNINKTNKFLSKIKIENDKYFWTNKFKYDRFYIMTDNLNIKEYRKVNKAMELSEKLIDLSISRIFEDHNFIITEIDINKFPSDILNKISISDDLLKFGNVLTSTLLEINILVYKYKNFNVIYRISGFKDKFIFVEKKEQIDMDNINFVIFILFYYYDEVMFWNSMGQPYDM